MSKAIAGAVEMAAVMATFAVAPYLSPVMAEAILSTTGTTILSGIGLMGLGQEIGAIADLFQAGPSNTVTTRQTAQPARIVYGQQRIAPTMVFESTTGGTRHQLNHVYVWASHQVESIDQIYLDGRNVYYDRPWGWGTAAGGEKIDDVGNRYNFDGKVYVEHRYGTADQLLRDKSGTLAPTHYISGLTANDPKWGPTCQLNGIAYSYIKCVYDANLFPSGQPVVKGNVSGKNDILDPRSGTRSFTKNAALIIADFMTNQEWGLRMSWAEIDIPELIASANVCDEPVATPNGVVSPVYGGAFEPRYTINGTFTTDSSPGDILSSMLEACAGRIVFTGGKYKIIVGYDRGASISFGEDDYAGPVEWSSRRSYRGLFNEVQGTFIASSYPYQAVGNYVDADHPQPGIFDGQWTPQSFPPFSFSSGRGYTMYPLYDAAGNPIFQADGITQQYSDVYMAEDNGERLVSDLKLQFVISASQAQRLAKIKLMRHRQQGTGKVPLKLCGLRVSAADNVLLSFAPFGWVDKEVEVSAWRFVPKLEDGKPPVIETEIEFQETDPASIYEWSPSDDLAMNAPDYVSVFNMAQVIQPTELVLASGDAYNVKTTDGLVIPRIRVTWTSPLDQFVRSGGWIDVQYQINGNTTWLHGPPTTGADEQCYIANVVQGASYNVRIRAVRSNGSTSPWLVAGPHVVSPSRSVITSEAMAPNVPFNYGNDAVLDSILEGGGATIRIYSAGGGNGSAWTRYVGRATYTMPSAHITGLAFTTVYFVVYDTIGGNYLAFSDFNNTLDDRLFFVGSVKTINEDGLGGAAGGGGKTAGGGRTPNFENPDDPYDPHDGEDEYDPGDDGTGDIFPDPDPIDDGTTGAGGDEGGDYDGGDEYGH